MTLHEFIESTQYLDKAAHLIIFAEGNFYTIKAIIPLEDNEKIIQLGCGWVPLNLDEKPIEQIIKEGI